MNNQEILDNAPEGATLYAEFIQSNLNTYAQKWGDEFRFWDTELNEWAFDGWWLQSSAKANFRSMSDIKRIAELESERESQKQASKWAQSAQEQARSFK